MQFKSVDEIPTTREGIRMKYEEEIKEEKENKKEKSSDLGVFGEIIKTINTIIFN